MEIYKKWKIYFYTLFYYVFGRAFERQPDVSLRLALSKNTETLRQTNAETHF